MVDKVEQRWAYREHHRHELVESSRAALEQAAIRNAAGQALTDGVELVGAPIVEWGDLSDLDVTEASRIDLDSDPWAKEFGPEGPTVEQVIVEEERRRAWWRGCRELRVTFAVLAEPERPTTVHLSEEFSAMLREQGQQVMVDKTHAAKVCGGVYRRHQFAPREAAWLRDGLIQSARCNDCAGTITRDELLERARLEEQYGTCHVDGDAFRLTGSSGGAGLVCPTCVAALRQ